MTIFIGQKRALLGARPAWTPALLFASGAIGVWYDPSDISTLFQDAAGTTPVTAYGQPVGRILDKSGNGIHATQSTSSARPLWQEDTNGKPGLKFDAVNDFLVTSSIDLSTSARLFIAAGVRKLADGATGGICTSASFNNTGTFALQFPRSSGTHPVFHARGTPVDTREANGANAPAPVSQVLTGLADFTANSCQSGRALEVLCVA